MIQELVQRDDWEEAVCGSIVCDRNSTVLETVRDIITAEDFENETYREFFELLVNLHDIGQPISDIKLVTNECKRRELKITNAEIAEAFQSVPNVRHANFYAERIANAANVKKVAVLISDTNKKIKPDADAENLLDCLEAGLQTISVNSKVDISESSDLVEAYTSVDRSERPAMTGIYRFDENFGGFYPGELVVIGARLGTGKTSLAWQIMLHSVRRMRPCLFVSLEMSLRGLYERHLAAELEISPIRIRSGNLTEQQSSDIEVENERFQNYPLSVFAPYSATVRQIRAAAKLKKSGGGLSMLFVDYYTKIKANRKQDRRLELEEISRDLKSLAMELGVPVVVLAQLNRAADEVVPKTSQLAECDALGRDADQVLLLHRKPEETDLRVAKHRFVEDNAAIGMQFVNGRFEDRKQY